jgi:hypothetical protein
MPILGAHLIDRIRVKAQDTDAAKNKVRPQFPPPRYILRALRIGDGEWEVQVFDTQ